MKFITAEIEYKYYIETNQLNLKLMNTQYKVKDKFVRTKHNNDFMKAFAQKFFRKKIKQHIRQRLTEVVEKEYTPKEMKVFWWESK